MKEGNKLLKDLLKNDDICILNNLWFLNKSGNLLNLYELNFIIESYL